jgi:hypothetical protein
MPRDLGDIELTLTASEETQFLTDLLNFLYDFNLFYEISRLGTDPEYGGFRPSPWMFTRNRRTLRPEDRLEVDVLSQESPTKLIARITCTAAAITALGTLVRLPLAPLEYEKLQLEIRTLRLDYERRAKELGQPVSPPSHTDDVIQENAEHALHQTVYRMERSPVRIEEVGVRLITDKGATGQGRRKRGK